MRRMLTVLALLGTLALLVAAMLVWAWWGTARPVSAEETAPVLVRVEQGAALQTIATDLRAQSLIPSVFWFTVLGRVQGVVAKPGTYSLRASQAPSELLSMLADGEVAENSVTIPEGWRAEEIADRLVQEEVVTDRATFGAAVSSVAAYPALVARLQLAGTEYVDGFLFPDTYRFALDSSATEVVGRFVANFLRRTDGLTLTYDTVILASIVEREARFDEDRPLIAGVYQNRIDAGMSLDADPTVQYAKANQANAACLLVATGTRSSCGAVQWWPTITVADYQGVDSPFSTYRNTGLPPRPIANPGLASLQAAAAPAEHEYLYFLSDSSGRTHFARTLAEHAANKRQYLR
ncbi:MAG: endolytic transglycosylase MltG [Patescibacteria group bacterium]|jgi:UPF0755 protein